MPIQDSVGTGPRGPKFPCGSSGLDINFDSRWSLFVTPQGSQLIMDDRDLQVENVNYIVL